MKPNSKKTKVIISTPKSKKSVRKIVLPFFIINLLRNIPQKERAADNFFLSGTQVFYEPRGIQRVFQRYVLSAGLKDVNFHALRHTFATRYMQLNQDVKTLSEVLGHSTIKRALETYIHSNQKIMRQNINRLKPLCLINKPSKLPSKYRTYVS